ncbi:MAG: hypothetical protein ACYC3X_25930 [Pirellulaceae bacterium]
MPHQAPPNPVKLYTSANRAGVLDFLQQVDQQFVPPLSSELRQGSLEAYLDYSLSGGNGRVLLYEKPPRIIGFLAYRYEQRGELPLGETIYLSNMAVSESLMGTVLIRLFQGLVGQVEIDGWAAPSRIWAKTWQQNRASARTLARMGLEHVQTVAADPAFRGCRDTLIFEGTWATFVRTARELCSVL